MLSTIVLLPTSTDAGSHRLAAVLRTLACLVPPTMQGVVRDVTLLEVGKSADAAGIADEAGCRIVQAEDFGTALARCLADARSSWIFAVRAGAAPGRSFGEDVSAALEFPAEPLRALLLRQDRGALGRTIPSLAPVAGVITPRERLLGAPCRSFGEILRRARPARDLPIRVPRMG